MRSYCLMCHTPADFIDLKTGECENCCADAVNSKLVSRQSVAGATRNLQARHEILHGKGGGDFTSDGGGSKAG